jgi:AcrR family transcriptional regulator
MSKPRIDPRVTRTRQLLFDGLIDLVKTNRWDKIRVQDVLENTGVSRSAFYAHFDNKYDLLTSGIPELAIPTGDEGLPDLLPLFAHVDEMAPVMRPLLTQPVLSEIADTFHRQFASSWADHLKNTPHRDDKLLPELMAGALTALVRWYAQQADRDAPEIIAAKANEHLRRLIDQR